MEIVLSRRNGAEANVPALVRTCGPADLAALFSLQNSVRAAMPDPEQFVPNSESELLEDLESSLCIGVFAEGEAAAYCILRYCGAGEHNYAHYLNIPAEEIPLWANGDSAVVAPKWRGNHLQQKMIGWLAAWRKPEIIGIACTVSPNNAYSFENVKACGFTVAARRMMYGTHDRYLLKMNLSPLPGRYRHFKGGEYRVLSVATHSETREPMVVYQALYGEKGIWVRPVSMWFEHVDRGDYHGPRFTYIGEA